MDRAVQIGADDDTQPGVHCALCAARANVDAAIIRAGASQVTIVITYKRTPFASTVVESSKALITFGDHRGTVMGRGGAHEEAIVDALTQGGVSV